MDQETNLENMFLAITKTDFVVKSQQRGDPDLTTEQKIYTLREIYQYSPENFLSRFKNVLTRKDVQFMDYSTADYNVKFHLAEIYKRSDDRSRHVQIRNRRLKLMKELEATSDYFGQEQMRRRCPLLFEQFIGKYLSEKELSSIKKACDRPNCLSEYLLDCVDNSHRKMQYLVEEHRQKQAEEYDNIVEEDDDSEDDETTGSQITSRCQVEDMTRDDDPASMTSDEKKLLQQDFLALMQERFLNGEEEEFDYNAVDDNVQYDSLDIREHDEEERYFDAD